MTSKLQPYEHKFLAWLLRESAVALVINRSDALCEYALIVEILHENACINPESYPATAPRMPVDAWHAEGRLVVWSAAHQQVVETITEACRTLARWVSDGVLSDYSVPADDERAWRAGYRAQYEGMARMYAKLVEFMNEQEANHAE